MQHLCSPGPFWDIQKSWNTSDPRFDPCFEDVALTIVPCVVFWILGFIQILIIINTRKPSFVYRKLMLAKMFNCSCLFALSLVELLCVVGQAREVSPNYLTDYLKICIKALTYGLSLFVLQREMKKGMYSTWFQFLFWMTMFLLELIKFWSLIRDQDLRLCQFGLTTYVIRSLNLPFTVFGFLLVCISDDTLMSMTSKDLKMELKNRYPDRYISVPGKLLFYWVYPLLWRVSSRNVEPKDLWELKPSFKTGHLEKIFGKEVEKQKQRKDQKLSLLKIWSKIYFWELVGGAIIAVIVEILRCFIIYFQLQLVSFIVSHEPSWHGYLYVGIIFLANGFEGTLISFNICNHQNVAMKLTSGVVSEIFKKGLHLSNEARGKVSMGKVINIMSTDTQRIIDLGFYFPQLYSIPVSMCLNTWLIWRYFGPTSLVAIAIWILVAVVFFPLSLAHRHYYIKTLFLKDLRLKCMSEILRGIKVLKMNAWEPYFYSHVMKIRSKELKHILTLNGIFGVYFVFWVSCKHFVPLALFGIYLLLNPTMPLSPVSVFTVITIQNLFQIILLTVSYIFPITVQCFSGVKRMEKFLELEELDISSKAVDGSSNELVMIKGASFHWSRTRPAILKNISLTLNPGELVMIIGSVGSGKSSLLFAILGEMFSDKGISSVNGTTSYVGQQGWLQNATIKNNILFGKPYDDTFYKVVIEACALCLDFQTFPKGDESEIGERGITLSGGQNLRVSLARAVYSRADINLLDDPLSAVDTCVGKHIFEQVIGPQGLLRHSLRMLVTHLVTYFPHSDQIIAINQGEITFQGSYSDLCSKSEITKNLLKEASMVNQSLEYNMESHASGIVKFKLEKVTTEDDELAKLVKAEEMETGSTWNAILYYISSMHPLLVATFLVCYIGGLTFAIYAEFWLSAWTADIQDPDDQHSTNQRHYRMGVFAALGSCYCLLTTIAYLILQYGHHLAREAIHRKLLENILHLPMTFFETTTKGRVLNRFSKDTDMMDITVGVIFNAIFRGSFGVLIPLLTVCIALPWLCFGALILLLAIVIIQRLYVKASRRLSRLEGVTRSPVIAFFVEALVGCETIRAFKRQNDFSVLADELIDTNRSCFVPFLLIGRWLESHLAVVSTSLITVAGILCVAQKEYLAPSIVAVIMTNAQLTQPLAQVTSYFSFMEIHCVAVERIKGYMKLIREANWHNDQSKYLTKWPTEGNIEFKNVCVRYREGLDLALENVNFKVRSGEKIGIVGRTGAGKSSLVMALFRIIEADKGAIYIDDVDVSEIGLHDLRSQLTIVPQDPVLFAGTLRFNLDPLGKHSDDVLYDVLECSHLKQSLQSAQYDLNFKVSEGGENFSVGQRQLICLARALLRNNKIVILDEATSSVDQVTDSLIQDVVRTKFETCTVLVIAHRVSTVMDSDRVLVMSNKHVVEFGSPAALLKDTSSEFFKIAKSANLV